MTSNPDESPDSPSNPSPTGSPSASSRDWLLVTSRILLLLSFVGIAMMLSELWRLNEETDVVGMVDRVVFYSLTAVFLGTVSAVLLALRQLKLLPDMNLMASRLSAEHLHGAPSWDELQEKDGRRKLFAWLWDCVSMIAGVFLFALGACMMSETQPILAAVFLTFAVLFPAMMKSSHRTRQAIFGVEKGDKSNFRETP